MKLQEQFVADFETTSVENYKIEKCVRVWAWNIRSVFNLEVVSTGINIDSFFKFIDSKNISLFFHNLKFDGQFIVTELLKRGFVFSKKLTKENQFTCLVDESGCWYSIEILWKKYSKNNVSTKIYDSLKKIPLSVKNISKAYNIEEVKGEINYTKYRPIDYEPTLEEWNYISNDTLIVAKALQLHFSEGMEKMTIASDSYNYFKSQMSNKKFKYMFSELKPVQYDFFRSSYKGGFVWVNPKFKKKVLENVISYDVNSLYSSVMYNCKMPYGLPKYFNGEYKKDNIYNLYIQRFKCGFRLKENHIPMIQLKNCLSFLQHEYITDTEGEIFELTLTNIDIDIFESNYDIFNLTYIDGYKFKSRSDTFKNYIDHFYEIKQKETGGKRQIAKLFLNSLYGKFGSARQKQNMIPVLVDDKLELQKDGFEDCEIKYIPIATFITSYARYQTIMTALKFMPNNFIYCDTDSIHLVGISDEKVNTIIDVDSKRLGAWKFEGNCEKALFLRQKSYIKQKDGKVEVTCCGMPNAVKNNVNFNNFFTGAKFEGKLQQKRVQGGVLLSETEFTIKS